MGLSDDQIIKLLEWFVNSSEVNKEWANRRKKGQKQAHEWLQPAKIKDLSDGELSDKFRDYYKRGSGDKQHLIQLNRERVLGDIKKLRKTIDYILNESIDISERLNQVLSGDYKIDRLGSAIATAILMDFKPEKYSLWNKKVEQGFSVLGWKVLQRGVSSGENYLNVMSALQRLKNLYQDQELSFLDVDFFLHTIAAEEEGIEMVKKITDKVSEPGNAFNYLILTYKEGSPWNDELGVWRYKHLILRARREFSLWMPFGIWVFAP